MKPEIIISVGMDFFCYSNPSWANPFPLDRFVSADQWKRRVAFLYHVSGTNIRAKSNLVVSVDDMPQMQPAGFLNHLETKNVFVPPHEVKVYGSEYRRYAFSAYNKLSDKSIIKGPVEIVHFGTCHGFEKSDPTTHGSSDCSCSNSWHAVMGRHKMIAKVTLVFPEWQRKFSTIEELTPKPEILKPDHPPINAMFFNEWQGFARPVKPSGVYASRVGSLVPPWLDEDYNVLTCQFAAADPGVTSIVDPELGDPSPAEPRGWTDKPPSKTTTDYLKELPKQPVTVPDPEGIVVTHNGNHVAVG